MQFLPTPFSVNIIYMPVKLLKSASKTPDHHGHTNEDQDQREDQ